MLMHNGLQFHCHASTRYRRQHWDPLLRKRTVPYRLFEWPRRVKLADPLSSALKQNRICQSIPLFRHWYPWRYKGSSLIVAFYHWLGTSTHGSPAEAERSSQALRLSTDSASRISSRTPQRLAPCTSIRSSRITWQHDGRRGQGSFQLLFIF